MKKKFASLLLVMALVFTMIPSMAFAATKSIFVEAGTTAEPVVVTATADAGCGFAIYDGTLNKGDEVDAGSHVGGEKGYVSNFTSGKAYTWGYLSAGEYTAALFSSADDYTADEVYNFTVEEKGQPTANVETDKATYTVGEAIKVTTKFRNIDAWVGLYKKGDEYKANESTIWFTIPAEGETFTINDKAWLDTLGADASYANKEAYWDASGNLKCGEYEVVVFKTYGYDYPLDTADIEIHNWNTGVQTKAPTCKTEGVKTFTCGNCQGTKTEAINKLEHTEVTVAGKAATCTATGLTAGKKCSACGEVTVAQKPVAKAAHKEVTVAGKAATCTAPGLTDGKQCSECKEWTVPQKATSVKAHTKVEIPAVAPTCTATGLTAGEKCSTCGTVTKNPEVVEKVPHVVATTEVVKKATAKANGSMVEKCACGEVMNTVVIQKASKITLSKATAVYTGKNIKAPTVRVKDAAGKTIAASNYTIVKPANVKKMKAIGRYTFTVKFKGNKYSGTQKVHFEITAKKPTAKKPAAAKKAVTVKWAKGKKAQVTGYEVMAATNKKFTAGVKKATVKGYAKTSAKIKSLKSKKTYYVKVRSYKTVKGVKVYSPWSAVKSVKVK